MRKKFRAAILLLVLVMIAAVTAAEATISTRVIMKVSRMTQSAICKVGEDLSMEVEIDGVEPTAYQWYFNDAAIADADHSVYTIADAKVEDSGVYRMDAFDADGKMLISMDISARVVDDSVPKSGDTSLPIEAAAALLVLASAALAWVLIRRRSA